MEKSEIIIVQNEDICEINEKNSEKFPDVRKYVIFCETLENLVEEIYYFIEYTQNKQILDNLASMINSVKHWPIDENQSVFGLDVETPVCEQTAKDMCSQLTFSHKKFDGIMKPIDYFYIRKNKKVPFSEKSKSTEIIKGLRNILQNGKIQNFLSDEEKFYSSSEDNDSSDYSS